MSDTGGNLLKIYSKLEDFQIFNPQLTASSSQQTAAQSSEQSQQFDSVGIKRFLDYNRLQ